MVVQILALLGIAAIVQHELNVRKRNRAQVDVMRRDRPRLP